MAKRILIKPLISEKADKLSSEKGHYSFLVAKDANKVEVRKAVEELYSVNVTAVNTMIIPGKIRRRNTRTGVLTGRKPAHKKAIITVAAGEKIDFFGDI